MHKKLIAVTALGALAAGALVGCASDAGSQQPTIDLWLPPLASEAEFDEQKAWGEILAPFEEEHDVKVDVTIVSWTNYEEKYLTGISSGDGPDVGYMYTEMIGDYIAQGAVVPFDDYLTPEATDHLLYLDAGKIDGKQYALPFVVGGARVLYANNEILAAAGVDELPTTWEEYDEAAAAVVAAGYIATVQPWGSPDRGMLNDTFFPALWQAGGTLFTEDGTATAFDSPEGVAAATFLHDLVQKGYMPADVTGLSPEEASQQFFDGEVAFWAAADSKLGLVEDAGIDHSIIYSLKDEQQGTFVASDALVLLDACEDKQLCTDLVTFIEAGPQMEKFHEWGKYSPIGDDEKVTDGPFSALYGEQPDILHALPIVPGGAATYNAIYTNLQQMMLGQKTPAEAMRDAAAEGDTALEGSK